MRVIAGKYKNKKIVGSLKGLKTQIKPTTSKVKEAVFSIIDNHFNKNNIHTEDSIFLDLCCGTGSMGIEAISRGFEKVYFIDRSFESLEVAKYNLNNLKSENTNSEFLRADLNNFKLSSCIYFDIIYLDPPYNYKIDKKLLCSIHNYLSPNSLLIVENSKEVISQNLPKYNSIMTKKYGKTFISILQNKE